jgi:hypothetical protein
MVTGQNPRRRSPKANQKAIRRVNRRRAKVKNRLPRLQVQQALLNDYPSGPKGLFLFPAGRNE